MLKDLVVIIINYAAKIFIRPYIFNILAYLQDDSSPLTPPHSLPAGAEKLKQESDPACDDFLVD
jgi:hypothetical protein